MLPTISRMLSRSSACAGLLTGGHSNSFGATDQSLPSTTGTRAMPSSTCVPCVTRYSQLGDVGQSNSRAYAPSTPACGVWSLLPPSDGS